MAQIIIDYEEYLELIDCKKQLRKLPEKLIDDFFRNTISRSGALLNPNGTIKENCWVVKSEDFVNNVKKIKEKYGVQDESNYV